MVNSFALSVGGFAILDNHLHVLCRLDPDKAQGWSDEEVVRRRIAVYPPKALNFDDQAVVDAWVMHHAKDQKRVKRGLGWGRINQTQLMRPANQCSIIPMF